MMQWIVEQHGWLPVVGGDEVWDDVRPMDLVDKLGHARLVPSCNQLYSINIIITISRIRTLEPAMQRPVPTAFW